MPARRRTTEPDPLPPEPDDDIGYQDEPPQQSWMPTPDTGPAYQPPPPVDVAPAITTQVHGAVRHVVKINVDGHQQELGTIDVRASIEQIISRWWDALSDGGTLYLYPVDMMNRVIRGYEENPHVLPISPHHEAIRRIKHAQATSVATPAGTPNAVDPMEVLRMQTALLNEQIEALRADNQRMRAETLAREQALANKETELAERQLALAVTTAENQKDLAERLHNSTVKSHESATQMLVAMFTQQQALAATMAETTARQQQAAADQIVARLLAMESADRTRAELAAKEERAREETRRKEAEEMRKERERALSELHERELESVRNHHETTLKMIETLQEKSDPTKLLSGMAAPALAIADAFGIDLKDVAGKFLGGALSGSSPGGWLDALTKIAETASETAVKLKELELKSDPGDDDDEDDDDDEIVAVQTPQGVLQMTKGQYKALAAQQQQQLAAQQQQIPAQIAQQPVANPNADLNIPPWPGKPPEPPALVVNGDKPVNNPASNLAPEVQKAGRKAVRQVLEAFAAAAPADRQNTLLIQLTQHRAAIEPYLKATGVRFAITEAGADDALANELISIIQPHIGTLGISL